MPRRIMQGTVVSSKNDCTVLVKVERRFRHPLYQKVVKKSSKYSVHDPENKYVDGDKVRIIESKPISKTKSWVILEDKSLTI